MLDVQVRLSLVKLDPASPRSEVHMVNLGPDYTNPSIDFNARRQDFKRELHGDLFRGDSKALLKKKLKLAHLFLKILINARF